MSSKGTHTVAGIVLGIAGGLLVSNWNLQSALTFAVGSSLASSLPDQLEIKWFTGGGKKLSLFGASYKEGVRHSLIPHRTITHWLLMWIALAFLSVKAMFSALSPESAFAAGVALSGLLHVVMDSRTPMGIPWFHPYKRTEG